MRIAKFIVVVLLACTILLTPGLPGEVVLEYPSEAELKVEETPDGLDWVHTSVARPRTLRGANLRDFSRGHLVVVDCRGLSLYLLRVFLI